jgi:hypothetical protein
MIADPCNKSVAASREPVVSSVTLDVAMVEEPETLGKWSNMNGIGDDIARSVVALVNGDSEISNATAAIGEVDSRSKFAAPGSSGIGLDDGA